MRSVRVIPCLDVDRGRVVKGVKFVSLRDAGDPVELALHYGREGADELVFLDITASSESRPLAADLAERVSERLFIPFTVGGGIRSTEDVRAALLAGADKVSLNTAAVESPELVRDAAERFGSQCVVVAIDALRLASGGWTVLTHGGRKETGLDAVDWARRAAGLGAGEILLTSVDADGTRGGYDVELTREVADSVPVPVIASGGAGKPSDLADAVLKGHADAVLVAGILHDGEHSIPDLKEALAQAGLGVRRV